jgi:hypothetical protein
MKLFRILLYVMSFSIGWLLITGCVSSYRGYHPIPNSTATSLTGSAFFAWANTQSRTVWDSMAVQQIVSGNYPSHVFRWVTIHTQLQVDSVTTLRASYQVTSDYLSLGSDADWSRVPLTAMAAQQLADSFQCFLPTRKIVDDIYQAARVKLAPMPMFAFRDSPVTMYQHHLIIEGLRNGRKGLIAGIKKDVVIAALLTRSAKPNRIAIYGWHQLNGKPIQPLYAGHVNWYADYSHGVRLVKRTIQINGRPYDYIQVMQDPLLRKLICDEADCDVYRYTTISNHTAPVK